MACKFGSPLAPFDVLHANGKPVLLAARCWSNQDDILKNGAKCGRELQTIGTP